MNRRHLLAALCTGALLPLAARAQPRPRVWRIGFLAQRSRPAALESDIYGAFALGMRELGYIEGKTCTIEWKFAGDRIDQLPALARELAASKPDVIVAGATPAVQAAHRAATSIPIVFVAVPDPVGEGFVKSLPKPGGTVTGLSTIVTEVSSKHFELVQSIIPKLGRVGLLMNPLDASDSLVLEQINGAAFSRGVKVTAQEVSAAAGIEEALTAIARARAGAVIVAADELFFGQRAEIARLAIKHRLPTIAPNREQAEAGMLLSYGQNLAEHYRRAASYVDKIFKGARAGDLPVEQPTTLELAINQKTAKALGISMPNSVLLRADRIIE